jgi:hypothetical protein
VLAQKRPLHQLPQLHQLLLLPLLVAVLRVRWG